MAEDSNSVMDSRLPTVGDLSKNPRFHARIFVDDPKPQCYAQLYGLLCKDRERYIDKMMNNTAVICFGSAEKCSSTAQDIADLCSGY